MTKPKTTTNRQPFNDDLDHLAKFAEWAAVRCRRIEMERDQKRRASRTAAKTPDVDGDDQLAELRAVEARLGEEVEARRASNLAEGPKLAIDKLVAAHDLDEFEANTLMLAVLHSISHHVSDCFGAIEPFGFGGLTVQGAFLFCGLDLADQVRRRRSFLPTAPLRRENLINLDTSDRADDASDLPSSSISLSNSTFVVVVGLPELAWDGRSTR